MPEIKINKEFDECFDELSINTNINSEKSNGKPKRKNSEKRKEKSRKAARERRSQESKFFDEIEELLPIPSKAISHLDKASLVRIAINYLKIRKVIEPIEDIICGTQEESNPLLKELAAIDLLNGFMIVLSKDGDMVYLSENVDKYLGLTQIDLLGQSIYDFSHPCDHNDIRDVLALKNHNDIDKNQMSGSFFVRMKCTLTNKGRNLNLKSASYKVIHFSGHILNTYDKINSISTSFMQSSKYFMASIGEPIEHPYIIEKPLNKNIFVSRHALDMKFTDVDDSVHQILGYDPRDLKGKSLFQFFHALDLPKLEKFFKTLFEKGQCESGYYRFLVKTGGHKWLSTQATVITDSHSSQPQSIICVNHVISGIENHNEITSEEQCSEEAVIETTEQIEIEKILSEQITIPIDPKPTSFVSSTKSVFAPKTAEMESGFIVFTDDSTGMTILSDAEDLTHLAPEAGDVIVPMSGHLGMDFNDFNFFEDEFLNQNSCNTNFFLDEDRLKFNDENLQFSNSEVHNINTDNVFKDNDESEALIDKNYSLFRSGAQNFNDNYSILRDDSVEDSPLPNDPFLCYNEDVFTSSPSTDSSDPYSSKSNSPINISSPILSQSSSFYCKSPTEDVSKLNINDTNDLIEDKMLEMRAPFIPTDEDFPLLCNDDLHLPYSSTNIDELISFEGLSNKPIGSDLTINVQQNGCLEKLLQSDSHQKTKKLNNNINQTSKQIFDNNGNRININIINPNINKCDNNSAFNKTHLIYNNINSTLNVGKSVSIGKCFINDNRQLIIGTKKPNKSVATEKIVLKRNGFPRTLIANKRPYNSEPPDILSSICPNDILSIDRSGLVRGSRDQKRIKVDNTETNNQVNSSVLMNLLVNGEDLTNGYSKCSHIDRFNQTSNYNLNPNNYQNYSTKNMRNNMLFDGQDIR